MGLMDLERALKDITKMTGILDTVGLRRQMDGSVRVLHWVFVYDDDCRSLGMTLMNVDLSDRIDTHLFG